MIDCREAFGSGAGGWGIVSETGRGGDGFGEFATAGCGVGCLLGT